MLALTGTRVSVIGGSAAAEVALGRQVRTRADVLRAQQDGQAVDELHRMARCEVAAEFDATHNVERALRAGSVDEIIEPSALRPAVVGHLRAARSDRGRDAATNPERSPGGRHAASA
jgi:acetyl-CoA carboxylase carboxyltransferase component